MEIKPRDIALVLLELEIPSWESRKLSNHDRVQLINELLRNQMFKNIMCTQLKNLHVIHSLFVNNSEHQKKYDALRNALHSLLSEVTAGAFTETEEEDGSTDIE